MPPAPAAAAAGYRPRPAQNQLKEIVEEKLEALLRHGDERFRDTYGPLHRRVRTVREDFLRCQACTVLEGTSSSLRGGTCASFDRFRLRS